LRNLGGSKLAPRDPDFSDILKEGWR
jgi:hypothetical protein